jgi:hypothetical protein
MTKNYQEFPTDANYSQQISYSQLKQIQWFLQKYHVFFYVFSTSNNLTFDDKKRHVTCSKDFMGKIFLIHHIFWGKRLKLNCHF